LHEAAAADLVAGYLSLKRWRRDWKIELIETDNSTWRDLYEDLWACVHVEGSRLDRCRQLPYERQTTPINL
jgi:hypothetical protein